MSDEQEREQDNPPLIVGLAITASMEVTKAEDIAKARAAESDEETDE